MSFIGAFEAIKKRQSLREFKNLPVWKKSHSFVVYIYQLTKSFPPEENATLIPHLRNTALNIASSIAEGCGRRTDATFEKYLQQSRGLASELEYLLLVIKDLEYISSDEYEKVAKDLEEIKNLLSSTVRKLHLDKTRRFV